MGDNSKDLLEALEKEEAFVPDPDDFYVCTLTQEGVGGYGHWSEGITVYIRKRGTHISLNADEIQRVIKSLPRTIGGVL